MKSAPEIKIHMQLMQKYATKVIAIGIAFFLADNSFAETSNLEKDCNAINLNSLAKPISNFFELNPKLSGPQVPLIASALTFRKNTCFLILSEFENSIGATAEILVIDSHTLVISEVSNHFAKPDKLRVAIGSPFHNGMPTENFYYVELNGSSAYEALKAGLAGVPISGFTGCVDYSNIKKTNNILQKPTGKTTWDPTPNRKWKIKFAEFSLKRGMTNEVDDMYSRQLDEDFSGYLKGSNKCVLKGGEKLTRGSVQPWSSFVTKYFSNSKWVNVDFDSQFLAYINPPPPPVDQVGNYKIYFRKNVQLDPEMASACWTEVANLGVGILTSPIISENNQQLGLGIYLEKDEQKSNFEGLACVDSVVKDSK